MKLLLLVVTALFAGAVYAYADNGSDVGAVELQLLEAIFTGNIGLTLGLAVTALGIWQVIHNNLTGGLILIVLGVLVTFLPGVYNGVRMIACPIANSLGGHCGEGG